MKKILAILIIFGLLSCSDDEGTLSNIPVISLEDIYPETIVQFQDSLHIILNYEDGDGDFGGAHPDSSNLFVIDNRIGIPYEFRIGQLVPNGAEVPIKGTLHVVINNLFLIDTGNMEMVDFQIYALDEKLNESNRINTPSIKVVR